MGQILIWIIVLPASFVESVRLSLVCCCFILLKQMLCFMSAIAVLLFTLGVGFKAF